MCRPYKTAEWSTLSSQSYSHSVSHLAQPLDNLRFSLSFASALCTPRLTATEATVGETMPLSVQGLGLQTLACGRCW